MALALGRFLRDFVDGVKHGVLAPQFAARHPAGSDPLGSLAPLPLGVFALLTPSGRGDERMNTGISVGGILVIVGIVIAIFWSLILGIIVALIGLIAFGGFARGRWY